MATIKESDFYYGAILSSLFNGGICPTIVEGGEDRQIYDFMNDSKEFRLFLKYRSNGKDIIGGTSWTFTFTNQDVEELKKFVESDRCFAVGLICGCSKLSESEYAIITKEEISSILNMGKRSLTINRKKKEKMFRVHVGGGRAKAMPIPANRGCNLGFL